MRFLLGLGLAWLLLASSGTASADEPIARPRRLELGLSSGYSVGGFGVSPHGSAFDTLWAVPLLLDIDYRVSKRWSVGAYGELGFIDNSADVEDSDETVKGHHYRLGVEAAYHSSPERKVQPWLGFGLGFDALRATYHIRSTFPPFGNDPPDPGSSSPIRATGFELGHAQLGIDFSFIPAFAFGPYIGASVVSYSKRRGLSDTDDFNVWSTIGLKATVRL